MQHPLPPWIGRTAIGRVCRLAWLAIGVALAGVARSEDVAEGLRQLPPWAARSAVEGPYRDLEGELTGLEQRLFDNAAAGRIGDRDLLPAALIAGGVSDPDELQRLQEQMAQWVAQLARHPRLTGTARQQAEAIFELMHSEFLRGGYVRDCTDLATTFRTGKFNCVSATVLYDCLVSALGLKVVGLESPGHAMSRLELEGGPLDVETTCPRWFRILDDPQKKAEMTAQARGGAPADEAHVRLREVSPVQMAAMIYYNRGVDLLAGQRYEAALAANAKALRLDPNSDTARGNLLATLNNWSIALGTAGQYAQAARRLEEGMRLDPAYDTLAGNYVHVHFQWIEHLCQSGNFTDALGVLARAGRIRPDCAYFRDARLEVYTHWARAKLDADQPDEAASIFASARQQLGDLPALREATVGAMGDAAARLARQQRYDEAARVLSQALRLAPDSTALRQQQRDLMGLWTEASTARGDTMGRNEALCRDDAAGQNSPAGGVRPGDGAWHVRYGPASDLTVGRP